MYRYTNSIDARMNLGFTNKQLCDHNFGKGAVLMQGRPFEFTNKQLCDHNLEKSTYEKEMTTILHAMEAW